MRLIKLVLFSLFFISSHAFSEDYYWRSSSNATASTPLGVCQQVPQGHLGYNWSNFSVLKTSEISFDCIATRHNLSGTASWNGIKVVAYSPSRYGTSCPLGSTYNSDTGACISVDPCPVGETVTAAVTCTFAGGNYVHADTISISGCEYVSAPGSGFFRPYPDYNDPAKTFCMATFQSTGNPLPPGNGVNDVSPDHTASTPSEGEEPECLTYDGHTFCQDPNTPNCGTRDGNPYCYGENDTCGFINGQHVCLPNGARKCTYVDGVYECVDPVTGQVISSSSPDHPSNGGNADGNDRNDEQAPGAVTPGTGQQSAGSGASNKSIHDLQDALTQRMDDFGEAMSGDGTGISAPTERGSLDADEWDQLIDDAKLELSTVTNQFGELFQGVTSPNITGSGGELYCGSFEAMGRTYELCLSQYSDQLEGIGLIILFVCTLIALFIIFVRD